MRPLTASGSFEGTDMEADGTVVIPDGPGLDVEIDEEKLFRYA